jgi:hypothetical protein
LLPRLAVLQTVTCYHLHGTKAQQLTRAPGAKVGRPWSSVSPSWICCCCCRPTIGRVHFRLCTVCCCCCHCSSFCRLWLPIELYACQAAALHHPGRDVPLGVLPRHILAHKVRVALLPDRLADLGRQALQRCRNWG